VAVESSPRSLRLRRPDHCVSCGHELVVGDRGEWDPGRRVVTCLVCVKSREDSVAVEFDPGVPGASAQREYDRRHARREDQAREKLGVLGVAIARRLDEPASTKAWARGAKGARAHLPVV
jgi:hypothetical protein